MKSEIQRSAITISGFWCITSLFALLCLIEQSPHVASILLGVQLGGLPMLGYIEYSRCRAVWRGEDSDQVVVRLLGPLVGSCFVGIAIVGLVQS